MAQSDDPLEELQQKIDAARAREHRKESGTSGKMSSFGRATQLATEFIAGAGVGSFCGYYLDRWLATSPVCLILGFLLGFAAGVRNLMRAAAKDDSEGKT